MNAYGLTMWHSNAQFTDDSHRAQRDEERMLAGAAEDATIRMRLVQVLSSLRQNLRITQRKVASLMGTTQSAVSDMEKGLTDPRLSTLQRHARAIGCRIDVEVVEELDDPHAAVARSLVHYSSWRHTNATTNQSNITLAVEDLASKPWRWLLDDQEVPTLTDQELVGHIRWLAPYEKAQPQKVYVAGIRDESQTR
jgi:transcriptional regulator with XRE-family HTH domain